MYHICWKLLFIFNISCCIFVFIITKSNYNIDNINKFETSGFETSPNALDNYNDNLIYKNLSEYEKLAINEIENAVKNAPKNYSGGKQHNPFVVYNNKTISKIETIYLDEWQIKKLNKKVCCAYKFNIAWEAATKFHKERPFAISIDNLLCKPDIIRHNAMPENNPTWVCSYNYNIN